MAAKTPFISVVIVSYNVEKYVLDCLKSLLFQSYNDFEIILVDDGSTDDTCNIIKNFRSGITSTRNTGDEAFGPSFTFFPKMHKGISASRNFGISKARGKIIYSLDSDDVLLPDTLRIVADYFHKNKNIDILYGDIDVIDDSGKHIYYRKYQHTSPHYVNKNSHHGNKDMLHENKDFLKKIFLSFQVPFKHSAMSYRKDFIIQLGGYNETFERLVDVELMCRALSYNMRAISASKNRTDSAYHEVHVGHISNYLVKFRRHRGGVTDSRKIQLKYWYRLIDSYYENKFSRIFLKSLRFTFENLKNLIHSVFYSVSKMRKFRRRS